MMTVLAVGLAVAVVAAVAWLAWTEGDHDER